MKIPSDVTTLELLPYFIHIVTLKNNAICNFLHSSYIVFCIMFGTTGLQVTGTKLLRGAVDSDRSSGSGSVTSSTGH